MIKLLPNYSASKNGASQEDIQERLRAVLVNDLDPANNDNLEFFVEEFAPHYKRLIKPLLERNLKKQK